MDIGTSMAVIGGVFGAVSTVALVLNRLGTKRLPPPNNTNGGRAGAPCMDHPTIVGTVNTVKEDVTTIKRVLFRLCHHQQVPVKDFEELVE